MVDNQHRQIKGYRELSEDEIAQMNTVKELGVLIEGVVESLNAHPDTDKRWVAIAQTHLQQGGMALTRSIAKPEFFF